MIRLTRQPLLVLVILVLTAAVLAPPAVAGPPATFALAGSYAAQATPRGVTLGDYDEDGDLDAVLVCSSEVVSGSRLLLYDGDGAGGFAAPTVIEYPWRCTDATLVDFDRDGHLDLVVANSIHDCMTVLKGDGAGGFSITTAPNCEGDPGRVTSGDIDGDGCPDLVFAMNTWNGLRVILGDGAGGIKANNWYGLVGNGTDVALADFDRDGHLDMAGVGSLGGDLSVLLNDGSGSFGFADSYARGAGGGAVAAGDLNRDGITDLVASSLTDSTVRVYTGVGDGTFTVSGAIAARPFTDLAIADVNRDGYADVVGCAGADLVVYEGDGTTTLGTQSSVALGEQLTGLALGDVNGDGSPDVVAADAAATPAMRVASNDTLVTHGFGYDPPVGYAALGNPTAVAVGDIDRDGVPDLAAADYMGDNTYGVALGAGDGSFPSWTKVWESYAARNAELRDLNGDGILDLVLSDPGADSLRTLPGVGDGSFAASASLAVGDLPWGVTCGDLDRDGNVDLVSADRNAGTVSVALGAGAGGLGAATAFAVGASPTDVALADFNGDGVLDIVTADSGAESVSLMLGVGDGTFAAAASTELFPGLGFCYPSWVEPADVNRDGTQDLIVGCSYGCAVLPGNGAGGFAAQVTLDGSIQCQGMTVADPDRDGTADVLVGTADSIVAFDGDGGGGFAPAVTLTAGVTASSLAVADLNRDGKDDIVMAAGTSGIQVLLADQTPPAGTMSIDGGAGAAPGYALGAGVTIDSAVTGATQMRFSNDGSTWSSWRTYAASSAWTLSAGDGAKTVSAQYRDAGQNLFETSAGITLDSTPPAGTMSVDGGAGYTSAADVTIDSAVTGATQMRFSNDGSTWSSWRAYAASSAWTLTTGDGAKTVSAEYRDVAGNVLPLSDGITLDTTPPAGTMSVDGGAGYTSAAAVTVDSAVTGAAEMRFSSDGATWSSWRTYAAGSAWTLTTGDGVKTVSAQYRDAAGNLLPLADGITLDTTPPAGNMAVGGAAAYTAFVDVTIDSAVTGAIEMRFSNDGAGWSSWRTYAASSAWTLGAGDGAKTVSAEYRDIAGNVLPLADGITLDTTTPVATAAGADDAWHRVAVDVALTATDSGSADGVQCLWYREGTATPTQVAGGAATITVPAVANDGVHTYEYWAGDRAGNESARQTFTVRIDTLRPVTKAPYRASVVSGRRVRLRFKVVEAGSHGPLATVKIRIRTLRGHTVKTIKVGTRNVDRVVSCTYRCRLGRGTYRFFVYATDAAGNTQSRVGRNLLTVK